MKSVYIITGGILVMIAVVFLAPQKQNNTKEEASTPFDELDAYILKEYGPILEKLSPEEKEIVRQDVADHLAREKAEMRKYGRLLTADERSTQWWQAQDEAAKQAAYAKLYEERKDWIDNSPSVPDTTQPSSMTRKTSRTVTQSTAPTKRNCRETPMKQWTSTMRRSTKSGPEPI